MTAQPPRIEDLDVTLELYDEDESGLVLFFMTIPRFKLNRHMLFGVPKPLFFQPMLQPVFEKFALNMVSHWLECNQNGVIIETRITKITETPVAPQYDPLKN